MKLLFKAAEFDTGKLDIFKEALFGGWNKREVPRTFYESNVHY